jgi:biopolymer transport protein ExbD
VSHSSEADRLGHDSEAIAGFLPLVDVLLALLCVAMVAFGHTAARHLPVQLPAGSGTAATSTDPQVVLAVAADGRLQLDGQPATRAELARRLGNLPKSMRLLVAADREAPFDVIVAGLSTARDVGITDVRLAVAGKAP